MADLLAGLEGLGALDRTDGPFDEVWKKWGEYTRHGPSAAAPPAGEAAAAGVTGGGSADDGEFWPKIYRNEDMARLVGTFCTALAGLHEWVRWPT